MTRVFIRWGDNHHFDILPEGEGMRLGDSGPFADREEAAEYVAAVLGQLKRSAAAAIKKARSIAWRERKKKAGPEPWEAESLCPDCGCHRRFDKPGACLCGAGR